MSYLMTMRRGLLIVGYPTSLAVSFADRLSAIRMYGTIRFCSWRLSTKLTLRRHGDGSKSR